LPDAFICLRGSGLAFRSFPSTASNLSFLTFIDSSFARFRGIPEHIHGAAILALNLPGVGSRHNAQPLSTGKTFRVNQQLVALHASIMVMGPQKSKAGYQISLDTKSNICHLM